MATGQAPGNPIPAMRKYQPVEHPVVVIGPQYLAQYPVELAVNSDFKVSDINGTLIFQVKIKLLSLNRRFLKDAAGNTLVNLRQKLRTMHGRWEAFRGESKEKNDLLFTAKKPKLFQFKTELDVFLGNNKGEDPDFKVKEGYSQSSCSIFLGDSNTMLAQVHGRHTLAIMPNVDYAFIVALVVVILDEINADDDGDAILEGFVDGIASGVIPSA
ncbi:PREDICTED: protein LURP-one-related 15-like isoform X2 [Populus euphratica]|uniref:Protein LURP-one-related 15-like isoform X2 n=1 Tax=Populus euphratica TaxID=75702 RepID=A0AAJ6V7S5_POPEU|nr:PREDICTED: protein LURP-one-related 15-like isoform X2 [Populus euphratica]